MKAILIDAATRQVIEVEYDGLTDLQRMVGGYIEAVRADWLGKDVMFADDEGLSKSQATFVAIEGVFQPIAGSVVLVGAEQTDLEGAELPTLPPDSTLDQVKARVRFLDRRQFQAWAETMADEPSSAITTLTADGADTLVLQRYGELFSQLPKPAKHYRGYVEAGGRCQVSIVDATGGEKALPPRLDVAAHSASGFQWGYGGSGPAQLALAILCDLATDVQAFRHHQAFKFYVIARLPQGEPWTLEAAQAEAWLDWLVKLDVHTGRDA